MTGAQIAALTQAGRPGVVGYRVWCAEHQFSREVPSERHATNLAQLHDRKDHQTGTTTPTTLDLSKAADYLLICRAEANLERSIPPATSYSELRADAVWFAVLDMWEALTGLTGDAAMDYAQAIRETGAKAAPIPF